MPPWVPYLTQDLIRLTASRNITQVLLIGCGDIRNILASLSARPPPHVTRMQLHLNDMNVAVLARSALMLHLVCTGLVDAARPGDVQFLWDVWYNTVWSAATHDRFRGAVQSLLDSLESRWDPLEAVVLV